MVYDNAVEAGNKVLVNTNLISMYGAPRIARTRLLKTANINETTILVESGLGWKAGDQIGIVPTAMRWYEADHRIITDYNNVTGVVTLDRKL